MSHALCLFFLSLQTLVESWLLLIPWLRAESSLSQTMWTPIMLLPSGNMQKVEHYIRNLWTCSDLKLSLIAVCMHYSRINKKFTATDAIGYNRWEQTFWFSVYNTSGRLNTGYHFTAVPHAKHYWKQLRFFAMRLRKKRTGMLIVKKPDPLGLSLPMWCIFPPLLPSLLTETIWRQHTKPQRWTADFRAN